jgi:DNA integrity scanning protein DisA with diadenylate cyclase activity
MKIKKIKISEENIVSAKYKRQLRQVETEFKQLKTKLPIELKIRMTELILHLMQNRKNFGIFVILGWKTKWQKFADTPDAHQDIFVSHSINIMKIIPPRQKKYDIMKTINFDGAIIIDRHGNILHSGAMIEGLRPRATAHKLNPNVTGDLSSQFGFKKKVHMRHIAAITSSYLFKDTTIFTVSEETNALHIFENGKIVYSTVRGEQAK